MADKLMVPDNQEYKQGEVRIANDVISVIAGMAMCETSGIYIDGKAPADFIDKSNAKNISRAVKIEVEDGAVIVSVVVSVEYGYNIEESCKDVQEKIKLAIQTMTSLTVSRVDVLVQDLIFKKEPKGEQKK